MTGEGENVYHRNRVSTEQHGRAAVYFFLNTKRDMLNHPAHTSKYCSHS